MRVKSRLDTRARFLRQKEKNIEAERKGGVIKDYQPVGVTLLDRLASKDKQTTSLAQSIKSRKQSQDKNNVLVNIVSQSNSFEQQKSQTFKDSKKGETILELGDFKAQDGGDTIQKFDDKNLSPVMDSMDSPRVKVENKAESKETSMQNSI